MRIYPLIRYTFLATIVLFLVAALPVCPFAQTGQAQKPASENDAVTLLASAKTFLVTSRTMFLKASVVENALRKKKEFDQFGLVLTREEKFADFIIEVDRSGGTTEFPYTVIHRFSKTVVATGKVNSLGGTASEKIARDFLKQLAEARKIVAARK